MVNVAWKMLAKISRLFSSDFLRKQCDLPLILPFYHCIDEAENCPHIKNLYPLRSIESFRQDIEYLCQNYQAISLAEILAWAEGKFEITRLSFYLSFDDGLRQCYDIISPILLEYNLSASFFINSDFVDNKGLMYRYKISLLIEKLSKLNLEDAPKAAYLLSLTHENIDLIDELCQTYHVDIDGFLRNYQPYCTTEQLQTMIHDGFHIGSHSATHPRYHLLDTAAQKAESVNAAAFISEEIYKNQSHINAFAFPFTDDQVSMRFWEDLPFDLTFGTAGLKHSPIKGHLQRLAIENYSPNMSMRKILKQNYLAYWIKKYLGKHYTQHPNF